MASPLLANLFLHYAFDRWMAEKYPQVPFERYADDAIVHCRKEAKAQEIRSAIAARLKECGLELHPEKTKVVYCKDDYRGRTYPSSNRNSGLVTGTNLRVSRDTAKWTKRRCISGPLSNTAPASDVFSASPLARLNLSVFCGRLFQKKITCGRRAGVSTSPHQCDPQRTLRTKASRRGCPWR